jgi:signal transduction histidine kinase
MSVTTKEANINLSEQKRSKLVSRLSVIVFIVTFFYMILDLFLKIHVQAFIYVGFLLCGTATFLLNYFNRLATAKIVGLLFFNGLIFLVASSEPFETGIHLHFFSAGVVAMIVYGFEEWKKGICFIALSLCLYLTIFLCDLDLIAYRTFGPFESRIFFVINITVTAIISTSSFLMFSKVTFKIEQSLRQNQEVMIAQNEKLEKANKELDRFVYSASHDLRAPLSSLTGLINLSGLTSDINTIREYHNHMQNRILVMDKFIKEIIDYSRNARVEVLEDGINLKKLVDEVADSLQFVKGSSSISLQNSIDETMELRSDVYRLKVVFSNLISNAVKYHDLEKPDPHIAIGCNKEGDTYVVKVEDNGMGIPAEHVSKIFDMFYRAHERSEGSGLGLYIVKETLSKIGGQITVDSAYGKGSSFYITLPVTPNG